MLQFFRLLQSNRLFHEESSIYVHEMPMGPRNVDLCPRTLGQGN